jgi:hypothetical protein
MEHISLSPPKELKVKSSTTLDYFFWLMKVLCIKEIFL